MNSLNDKNVLITGGSSGIGKSSALAFARKGANVMITHLNDEEGASRTLDEISTLPSIVKTTSCNIDIAAVNEISDVMDVFFEKIGHLDILVCSAGENSLLPPLNYTENRFDRVMAVNLKGPFYYSSAAISHFLENKIKGKIVIVSSVHETKHCPDDIVYGMSKSALGLMTRTFAHEYAKYGIRINNVAPGVVDTPWNADWISKQKEASKVLDSIPMRCFASPEEVANTILFLTSDESSYTTGQTIYIDGGFSL